MVAGRTLPLLQDTEAAAVWDLWAVTYRDVILLDAQGVHAYTVNLTDYALDDQRHLDTVEALLRGLADE